MVILSSIGFIIVIREFFKFDNGYFISTVLVLIIFIAPSYIEIKEDKIYQINDTKFIGGEIQPETYNCAVYMRHFNQGKTGVSFPSNNLLEINLIAGTYNRDLPPTFSKDNVIINDWEDIISGGTENFWSLEVSGFADLDSGLYWNVLRGGKEWDSPVVLLSLRLNLNGDDIYYVVVNPHDENKILSKDGEFSQIESYFLNSVNNNMYSIYQNDLSKVRYLHYQ